MGEGMPLFRVRSKNVDYEALEVEYHLDPDPRSREAIRMGPVTLRHRLGDPGVPDLEPNGLLELDPEIAERLAS